jgi:hypothetical protein
MVKLGKISHFLQKKYFEELLLIIKLLISKNIPKISRFYPRPGHLLRFVCTILLPFALASPKPLPFDKCSGQAQKGEGEVAHFKVEKLKVIGHDSAISGWRFEIWVKGRVKRNAIFDKIPTFLGC